MPVEPADLGGPGGGSRARGRLTGWRRRRSGWS
jgi:hypothetical protein